MNKSLKINTYICTLNCKMPTGNYELKKMGSTGIDRMEISK